MRNDEELERPSGLAWPESVRARPRPRYARKNSRTAPGQLGEPQFELALSGWYWQIIRLDVPKTEIRSSRSLFAAKLPRLCDSGVPAGPAGARRGYATGPDDRVVRMLERVIDTGDQGIYLIQVAATTEEIEAQISRFEF